MKLTLAEGACLTLVAQGAEHGSAVAAELAPDSAIGRVWSLSRPLTYRTLDQLVFAGLADRRGHQPARGRDRRLVTVTRKGRAASGRWLDEPAAHLRDVRTELLVKLLLRDRWGLDRRPLLVAQQLALAPRFALIAERRDGDLMDRWRHESSLAVQRFIEGLIEDSPVGF